MSQLIYEFGSDAAEPMLEVLLKSLANSLYSLELIASDNVSSSASETLEIATKSLQDSAYDGLCIKPVGEDIRYELLIRPNGLGEQFSLWRGTIEYIGTTYWRLWDVLMHASGLCFVCLSLEEGIELRDDQITPTDFPWKYELLVIGALKQPDGKWYVGAGPAFKDLAQFGGVPEIPAFGVAISHR